MTHICVSKLTIIGANNGLSRDGHQAIIRTNTGILLIHILGTNFSEILSEIHIFSFKKCIWKCLQNGGNFVSAYQPVIEYVKLNYRKVSNISRTKSQNLNASRLIL